jgi:hypothetical protein
MPACLDFRVTVLFLALIGSTAAFAEPSVNLNQLAAQRAVVTQAFQAYQDQEKKVTAMEQKLTAEEGTLSSSIDNGAEQAGQRATSAEIEERLQQQAQVIAQIQDEQGEAASRRSNDFIGTQDQIVATQIDHQQQLQELQSQISLQQQNVAQLDQTVQTQRATNIDSPLLENALAEYQQQNARLENLEELEETLAVQVAQDQVAQNFSQTQSTSSANKTELDLQSRYDDAQKNYRQLQENYQLALSREESERRKASDLHDDYQVEKEKQLALGDNYDRESKKLAQMLTGFSKP